jgi:hypothetical protein
MKRGLPKELSKINKLAGKLAEFWKWVKMPINKL